MTDLMEQMKKAAWEPAATTVAHETPVKTDVHETIDRSLSSIVGNARMIALDAGVPGQELARRLAAIIDSAQKISLIVHRQFSIEHPADTHGHAGKSQPGAERKAGQERVHAGHRLS